jgi:hypothetical protein
MTGLFKNKVAAVDGRFTTFSQLETLQVNLGDLCNLSCAHCHHNARRVAPGSWAARLWSGLLRFWLGIPA